SDGRGAAKSGSRGLLDAAGGIADLDVGARGDGAGTVRGNLRNTGDHNGRRILAVAVVGGRLSNHADDVHIARGCRQLDVPRIGGVAGAFGNALGVYETGDLGSGGERLDRLDGGIERGRVARCQLLEALGFARHELHIANRGFNPGAGLFDPDRLIALRVGSG